MKWSTGLMVTGAVGLLVLAGTAFRIDEALLTPTTFGTTSTGYRGLFELLSELQLAPTRTGEPERLPVESTVWWFPTLTSCSRDTSHWPGLDWVQRGGTAVALLASDAEYCGLGSEVPLPPRQPDEPLFARGLTPAGRPRGRAVEVGGELTPRLRTLDVEKLATFTDAIGWHVVAWASKRPFILERAVGKGQVVVVADAAMVTNAWLDQEDAAPLAVDLAQRYGTPTFYEGSLRRGLVHSASAYLARSAAAPVAVGLLVLGVLGAWHGRLVPARVLPKPEPAPSLREFIDSLAALYARTHDYGRALERYREVTVGRLRRHFGLPLGTSAATIVARIRRARPLEPDSVALLERVPPPHGEAEFTAVVHALDRITKEVLG